MVIVLEIPKEFNAHFNEDRFTDSFARICHEIKSNNYHLCGNYERELIDMLIPAFQKAHVISDGERLPGPQKGKTNLSSVYGKAALECGKWDIESDCEGKTRTLIHKKCGFKSNPYVWKNYNFCPECGARMKEDD